MENIKKKKKKLYKEVKFRPNIADNDLKTKIKQIVRFLTKGLQVRITVNMKGRENIYKDVTHNLLNRIEEEVKDLGKMDKARKSAGRSVQTMISPIQKKK